MPPYMPPLAQAILLGWRHCLPTPPASTAGGLQLMTAFRKLLASVAVATGSATSGGQMSAWEVVKEASCPGEFAFQGLGNVSLVPTGWVPTKENVTFMQLQDGIIHTQMRSRAYFASSCTAGEYDNQQYLALDFRGKTFRYTTDLSQAGCGCNAALYLTSMRQNKKPSECGDYYCDANNVCGEACAEIDIQEANRFAWHSTLHGSWDHIGKGKGYGGGGPGWNGPRDWSAQDFGPDGRCVDTKAPFEVSVYFPVDGQGRLTAMEVTVGQHGHKCVLWMRVDDYGAMADLDTALAEGMTPIVSYWRSEEMLWLDGKGMDNQGPCLKDLPDRCGDTVRFYNFSISPAFPPTTPTTSTATPSTAAEVSDEVVDGAGSGADTAQVRAFLAGASATVAAQIALALLVWAVRTVCKRRGQPVCPGVSPLKRVVTGSSQSLLVLAESGGSGPPTISQTSSEITLAH
mmetsp:Transcript_38904/g.112369  ORF Transcript_38904/g.112369 Transcript_38904/m.112369 type:complete len:459 (+) Transcript_38904:2-1378(+)